MPARKRSRKAADLSGSEQSDAGSEFDPSCDKCVKAPAQKRSRVSTKTAKASQKKSGRKNAKARVKKMTKKKVNEIKKKLNQRVRTLAKMVNLDWHDGYEEQGEELCDWFDDLAAPINLIYEYCVAPESDDCITVDSVTKCNEILKIISDTWNNIHAIPARCCMDETLMDAAKQGELRMQNEGIKTFSFPTELIAFMWRLVLLTAAWLHVHDRMDTGTLLRFIKDAYDNGVKNIIDYSQMGDDEEKEEQENEDKNAKKVCGIIAQHPRLVGGKKRLQVMVENEKKEWMKLPNDVRVHKMRRAIDRRFDGDRHLRTRNYDSDGVDDCCIM